VFARILTMIEAGSGFSPKNACEDIVPMSKLLSVSSVAALAIALASCSTSTAPASIPTPPRAASVATSSAVPAVPTAPVALNTNSTESTVSASVPVAALQAIVQAVGGPATITMTDVAPNDYSSLLPAGTVVDTNSVEVIQFSAQRSGASLAVETPGTVLGQIAPPNLRFSFRFTPYGYTCRSAVTAKVFRFVAPNSGAAAPLENLVISSGNPQVISVDVGVPSSTVSRFLVVFTCDRTPVFLTVTGAR
jgi:hypothetical protein